VKKSPFHPHSPLKGDENFYYISIYLPSPLAGEGRVRGILNILFTTSLCYDGWVDLEVIF
jgi:hypothetical protein